MGEKLRVDSTLLAAVDYEPATSTLEAELKSGERYAFYMVSQQTWDELKAAASKGKYFNESIRTKFPFEKLADSTPVPPAGDLSAQLLLSLKPD